jgi:hypothetical protein
MKSKRRKRKLRLLEKASFKDLKKRKNKGDHKKSMLRT